MRTKRSSDRSAGAYDDETLWNYEAGVKYSKGADDLQRRRLPHQDQGSAGHARCRQLLVAHRVQRADKAHTTGVEFEVAASARSKASICRWPAATSRPSSTTTAADNPVAGGPRPASATATACRPCRSSRWRPRRLTASASATMPTGTSMPASSMSAAATPSRPTRKTTRVASAHGLPVFGMDGSEVTIARPEAAGYQLVNLSAGIEFDSGLSVVALCQQPVRRERQAVVRPRAWRPGTSWLQHRPAADGRHHRPAEVRQLTVGGGPSGTPLMTRRSAIGGMTAGALAPAVLRAAKPGSAAHVAVIGAGVFGAWTAEHLRRAGHRVTLVDMAGPANSRASSGGESRMTRGAYGKDEIYTRMAFASLPEWKALSDTAGLPIFMPHGVLFFFQQAGDYFERQHCGPSRIGPAARTAGRAANAAPLPDDRFQRRPCRPVRSGNSAR